MSAPGTAVTAYDKQWAVQAERYAAQEQLQGGTFLSTRGGVLKFGDEAMPGNQACVIVLDAVKENTYYPAKFDPEQAAAPVCYAFGRDSDEMSPHPSMQIDLNYFKPQSTSCDICAFNEWGSADKGKGKACQNRRRLALIPAGYYEAIRGSRDFNLRLFDDPKHFEQSEVAYMKLPVGSVKEWSKYVQLISGQNNRPPHGVVTRIFVAPSEKYQYQVLFEAIDLVPDSLAQIMFRRHDEALKSVIQGYKVPEVREPRSVPGGGLRGLRR